MSAEQPGTEKNTKLSDLAKSFAFKKLPDSEVELSGEISVDVIAEFRDRALKHVAEHIEMPGFRPGHVPLDIALKKVGEVGVLEESMEVFIQEFYPTLIEAHGVDAVGRPDIRITKMVPGNPVGLTVRATIYPTVVLPKNWRAVGENIPAELASLATDEEVEQTLESLRQSRASSAKATDGQEDKKELPELNDEFAKSVGAFETLEALKVQMKKGIGEEKERAAKDARRGKIINALLEKVEVEVPAIFVESELDKIMGQMKEDIARFNIPFEDYLKKINKTEEEMRTEFREQAKKRAKLQLTLNKIAEEEKLEADKETVEAEIKHALEHFPSANLELLRIHIETVLKNEKALRLLEGNTEPMEAPVHRHE